MYVIYYTTIPLCIIDQQYSHANHTTYHVYEEKSAIEFDVSF